MGIAAGKPVEVGRPLSDIDAKESLASLAESRFTGYACVTLLGKAGLEEGIAVFEQGDVILASYEYFKHNKKYSGETALKRFLNSLLAPSGVIDLFSLTKHEIKLVETIKDDWITIRTPADSLEVLKKFSEEYSNSIMPRAERAEADKIGILKKLGFRTASEVPYTRGSLLRQARKETA